MNIQHNYKLCISFASFFPCTCCWAFNIIVICLTNNFTNSLCLCIYSSYISYSSSFSILIVFLTSIRFEMFSIFLWIFVIASTQHKWQRKFPKLDFRAHRYLFFIYYALNKIGKHT